MLGIECVSSVGAATALNCEPTMHIFNEVTAHRTGQLCLAQDADFGWQRQPSTTLEITPGLSCLFSLFMALGFEHRPLHLLGVSSSVEWHCSLPTASLYGDV